MYASPGNNLSSVDHGCDPDINSHFQPVSAPPGFFPYLSLDLAVTSKTIPYVAIGPFTVDRSNGVPESVPSAPEHLFRVQLFRCKCPITTKSPRKAAPPKYCVDELLIVGSRISNPRDNRRIMTPSKLRKTRNQVKNCCWGVSESRAARTDVRSVRFQFFFLQRWSRFPKLVIFPDDKAIR